MQIETIDAIHGHAMFTTAAYEDAPKLYQALWEKLRGVSIENPLVVFQCFDSPSQLSNPTHEYVCLIGQHSALKPIGGVKQHVPRRKGAHFNSQRSLQPSKCCLLCSRERGQVQNLKVRDARLKSTSTILPKWEEEQLLPRCASQLSDQTTIIIQLYVSVIYLFKYGTLIFNLYLRST
ncbi:Hypothetical_protein [Hexamita inflata]|uniref:Hypothetical_protein n=1 Tax=Hexamita inflata TaxID=28002 RepID=A0AA86NZI6_9EUKA|nr:Hypothetical protein HINF_LOCUS15923 [Hexamita inflata]